MNDANQSLRRRPLAPTSLSEPLRRLQASKKRARSSLSSSSTALAGVVICLSGLDVDLKDHLHNVVTYLGGTYSREFDPKYVTHLVLDEPAGSKYEFVKHSKEAWAKKIFIVKSSWVVACERARKRVAEKDYALGDEGNNYESDAVKRNKNENEGARPEDKKKSSQPTIPKELSGSLETACNWMLDQSIPPIFSCRSFILVGFDEANGSRNNQIGVDGSSRLQNNPRTNASPEKLESIVAVKEKLSKLIRRACGTIYWQPNELINVIVVQDGYSKEVWDDVRYFCQHHPRGPIAVTAKWVLHSLHSRTFEPPNFLPEPIRPPPCCSNATRIQSEQLAKPAVNMGAIFKGDIFAIVKLTPPSGTVEFPMDAIQSTITNLGGILLNKKIFEAIKGDLKTLSRSDNDGQKLGRKVYVVSSGGYHLDHANFFPLLADLVKLGVEILPVNPVWVLTCADEAKKSDPVTYPLLFQPQTWPLRMLPENLPGEKPRFMVAVTEFKDSERFGIINMLNAIGVTYTDNLRARNTHLICKVAQGNKFKKALVWGMHIVSSDWLYHVIQFGYRSGCEDMFSLDPEKRNPKISLLERTDQLERSGEKRTTSACANLNREEDPRPPIKATKATSDPGDGMGLEARKDSAPRADFDVSGGNDSTEPARAASKKGNSDEHNRRLQFALESLQTTTTTSSKKCEPSRRSLRRRGKPIPIPKMSQDDEEENTQHETQLTIRVDDDLGLSVNRSLSGEDSHVPMSQPDEDNYGESQVVWFPANG